MPLATLLMAPALLATAALVAWCLRLVAPAAGRPVTSAAAWAALVLGPATWFAGSGAPRELAAPFPVAGVPLILRLDAVTVLAWTALLVPVALLLTFQRRTAAQAAIAALTASAGLFTLAAGSLVLAAFGLATCAGLVLVLFRQEEPAPIQSYWTAVTAAWLLMAWAAVLLQVTGGTSAYSAVPVTALREPPLALLAAAALLCSGVLPWRTWVPAAWSRRRLEAGALAVALLVPVGLTPLVRAYGLGAGQLAASPLGLALSAAGAIAAVAAAVRAQAATSRRGFLAEAVPLGGGLSLLALGLGSPLGMVAALACLAGMGLAAGLAPLAADGRGPVVGLAILILAGVPPAVVFGGWLLSLQAALEADAVAGFLGLVAVAAWLLALAAGARALRLPPAPPGVEAVPSPRGALTGVAVALAAGVALTALLALLVVPAAAEALPPTGRLPRPAVSPSDVLGAGALTVGTASGGWAAVLLAGPLVALALAGVAVARLLGWPVVEASRPRIVPLPTPPEPLLVPPQFGPSGWATERLRSLRLGERYRSLLPPNLLERAASSSWPWFWIVVTAVLAVAVTR